MAAPRTGEKIHEEATFASELQKTALAPPYTSPNPTIDPTMQ